IRSVIVRNVLNDHVHFDISRADRTENLEGHARCIGYTTNGQLGLVTIEGDAGNDGLFHGDLVIKGNEGTRTLLKTVQHSQWNAVFAGKFDSADLQHLGTKAGHFQHFFEGDALQSLGLGHDPGAGGVDAIDVRIDLTLIGLERGRQGNARGVGTATPKGGDVAALIDPLEAGHDNDLSSFELAANVLRIDLQDSRLAVGAVSADAYLVA